VHLSHCIDIDILQVPGNAAPDLLAHAPPSAMLESIWRNMLLDALVCYQKMSFAVVL
jgi:hypothetical protein